MTKKTPELIFKKINDFNIVVTDRISSNSLYLLDLENDSFSKIVDIQSYHDLKLLAKIKNILITKLLYRVHLWIDEPPTSLLKRLAYHIEDKICKITIDRRNRL